MANTQAIMNPLVENRMMDDSAINIAIKPDNAGMTTRIGLIGRFIGRK